VDRACENIGDLFLEYRDFLIMSSLSGSKVREPSTISKELLPSEKRLSPWIETSPDSDFIEALKSCAPGIYRARPGNAALAVADKLSVEPRRLSPEEREAKIIRFRERLLNRLQVKAEDRIALKLQRFFCQQLRERGEAMGLDDDELDRLEQSCG